MRTVEDYRKRAMECMELAQRARATERPRLFQIAQVWIKLADDREAALRLEAENPPKEKPR